MKKKILLVTLLVGNLFPSISQPHISGRINLTNQWESTLYVLRLDRIDLNYFELADSIPLTSEGRFNYSFKPSDTLNVLYKLTLPPKGANFRSSIGGANENYFILSMEDSDSLFLTADSDSLYYSLNIEGGPINRALLIYREHSKPFFRISRAWSDSLTRHPDQEEEYNKTMTKSMMEQIEFFKKSVIETLDTASNSSVVLAGLCYLNSAYLGILPGEIIKRYLPKVPPLDIPMVRNLHELAESVEANRKGLLLPDLAFKDSEGNSHSLHGVAAKLTVIDFWASWCNPCRQANKSDLPALYESFRNDPDKQLISISIDTKQDRWKQAMEADKVTWPQYVDESRAFANLLSVSAVPLYLVLDENKKIVYETISVYHLKQFLSNMGND